MVKRVAAVPRISRSLNSTASQILSIYRSSLFLERSIDRIIFGPEKLSVNSGELPEFVDEGIEREDEVTTSRTENARQESASNGTNEFGWVLDMLQDNATIRI